MQEHDTQCPAYASEKGHWNCWFQQKHTTWSAVLLYKKKPQTWSLSPPCTCMCRIGDPSHQTARARDKCGSLFPDSRNQTPCSCMCTGMSSLAPFTFEGQVYFFQTFHKCEPWKNRPDKPLNCCSRKRYWLKWCVSQCAPSNLHQPNLIFAVHLRKKLFGLSKWWVISSSLQTITPHRTIALKSSYFKGVLS